MPATRRQRDGKSVHSKFLLLNFTQNYLCAALPHTVRLALTKIWLLNLRAVLRLIAVLVGAISRRIAVLNELGQKRGDVAFK